MISEGVCSIREAGSLREEECKAEGTKSHFVFSFRDPTPSDLTYVGSSKPCQSAQTRKTSEHA